MMHPYYENFKACLWAVTCERDKAKSGKLKISQKKFPFFFPLLLRGTFIEELSFKLCNTVNSTVRMFGFFFMFGGFRQNLY